MTLDVDGLLSPICDEFPGGDPLAYSRGLHSQLSEFRNPARSSNPDDPDRDGRTEPIDWKAITDLAESALRSTTKDLRVACHLTQAAMHRWGLPELRTGLTLLRRLRAASHGGHSSLSCCTRTTTMRSASSFSVPCYNDSWDLPAASIRSSKRCSRRSSGTACSRTLSHMPVRNRGYHREYRFPSYRRQPSRILSGGA